MTVLAGPPSVSIAMLLADSRLPVGAHVSSNGVEPALRGGLHPSLVPEYMATRMRTVVLVEAGTAVVARAVASQPGSIEMTDALGAVDEEWSARTPSEALRVIGVALGAGLSRLACALWPSAEAVRVTSGRPFSRPVVLGAVASVAGLESADLARLVAYDDAQTVAAALLKLDPIDPRTVTRWVLDACALFDESVDRLAALTTAAAIPAVGAPQIEEWAQAHSHRTRRLFRA